MMVVVVVVSAADLLSVMAKGVREIHEWLAATPGNQTAKQTDNGLKS